MKEPVYTSTGIKLIHHTEAVDRLKVGLPTPISLQVAPTSRCTLNCIFCSNANRDKHEDLPEDDLIKTIIYLSSKGLKTVEWTGGGDPTLYEHINAFIGFCNNLGFEQGFITNGLLLKERIEPDRLKLLKWVRISMNCLDYKPQVDLPEIKGTLGFSYVMNDLTTDEILLNLSEHVKKYNPKYVRIVPNCLATFEEQEENNRNISQIVKMWGEPYFYQAKNFSRPERCWWGYVKPFLLHDGYFYPCSSVVLNEGSDKTFHHKYRWAHLSEIGTLFNGKEKMVPFPTENCSHCVFRPQNDLMDSIVNPNDMINFV